MHLVLCIVPVLNLLDGCTAQCRKRTCVSFRALQKERKVFGMSTWRKTSPEPWRKAWKSAVEPAVTPRDAGSGVVCPQELSLPTPCDLIEQTLGAVGQVVVTLGSIPECSLSRAWVGLNDVWGPGRTREWPRTPLFYCDDAGVDLCGCRHLRREEEEP